MKKLLLSLLAVVATCISASAETSTLTIGTNTLSDDPVLSTTNPKTVDATNGIKWTFTMSGQGKLESYDPNKGAHFGSNNKIISSLDITSEGCETYTISKVTINTSGNSGVKANVSVSVNGVDFTCDGEKEYALTATPTDAVFEGEQGGNIKIHINCTAKAFYINSIVVEYSESAIAFKQHPNLSFPQHDYYVPVSKVNEFEAPVLSNPYGVSPITYSVDVDEDTALIDEKTGDIVLESKVGDVTVTASFPGNDEYEADEQSYVIHITDSEFVTVTFDFEKNDYGMTVFSGSTSEYNAPDTKFGEEWVVCTVNERTRMWTNASGQHFRIYKCLVDKNGVVTAEDGKIEVEAPAGTEIINIGIFHFNKNGDAIDVTEDVEHEHLVSIEGNKAILTADANWDKAHELSALEVTYTGSAETLNGVVEAFKAGQHSNGDSHFTVKVNNTETESNTISYASATEEAPVVELAHYYPHATIYTKFEPAETPELAYYYAAEGFTEHTEPLTISGSGTLSYYAEMNGHTSDVKTITVTDTTTSISEINAADKGGEVYDLQGRRVLAPARGLYIINGKLQLSK